MAAPNSHHEMTVDHKAAYLNASLKGLQVAMFLPIDATVMIFSMKSNNGQYLRKHGKPRY
jgi:hypothetical protein